MSVVEEKFKRIGAHLDLRTERQVTRTREIQRGEVVPRRRLQRMDTEPYANFALNVQGDGFIIQAPPDVEMQVLDVKPEDRHLLLLARDGKTKARFLCGHDERQWFVATVPGGASNVAEAKEALKPQAVLDAEHNLKPSKRSRRRNKARVRQGDWFFLPADIDPDASEVLRNEPLMRQAGGHVHLLEEAYRTGGIQVFVPTLVRLSGVNLTERAELRSRFSLGATQSEREAFFRERPEARDWEWTSRVRNPELYARGKVTHPEHKTIELSGWHRVLSNTEPQGLRRGLQADMRFQNSFLD